MKYITPPEIDIDAIVEEFKESLKAKTNNASIEFKKSFSDFKIDETKVKKPTIYFSMEAWLKMQMLVKACDDEIAWQATVEKVNYRNSKEDWYYFVKQVFVYPQKVTGTFVDTDPVEYTEWSMKIPDEIFNKLRFQGHSHVNMATGPSATDYTMYQAFLDQLEENDYYIFMILNKRGEFNIYVYDYAQNLIFENTDCTVDVLLPNGGVISRWAQENMKLVTKKPVMPQYNIYDDPYMTYSDKTWDNRQLKIQTTPPERTTPVKGTDGVTFVCHTYYVRNGHTIWFENDRQRAYFFLRHPELQTNSLPSLQVKKLMDEIEKKEEIEKIEASIKKLNSKRGKHKLNLKKLK